MAQPSGARAENFIYKVLQKDTLTSISEKYTDNSNNWSFLQDLNKVKDTHKLPIGLELKIPFRIIPVSRASAQVINISGSAKINGSSIKLNNQVNEGDTIKTANNTFVTIQMPDFSLVMVPSNSTLSVKRLRTFTNTGLIDSIFLLDNGQLESVVAPNNTGTGRFEIRTPVNVTGVRGTKLRVKTSDDYTITEVTSGLVQLGRQDSDGPEIKLNQGGLFNQDPENGEDILIANLPPAPKITNNAEEISKQQKIYFEPVDLASHYVLTVAADSDGAIVSSKNIIESNPASFSIPGAGTWYILLRTVDTSGFSSLDAVVEIDGLNVLNSGFGLPVKSGFSENILLSF